jgi:hypothetical protein
VADELPVLRYELQAEYALASLGHEERRRVEGWLEHIRHWPDDPLARARSRRLKPDEELYAFQAEGSNLIVFFTANGNEITVLSIANSGWLRYFQKESSVA